MFFIMIKKLVIVITTQIFKTVILLLKFGNKQYVVCNVYEKFAFHNS